MKQFTSIQSRVVLILVFMFCLGAHAQVYNADLTLSSQAEVDAFNYSEVTGNLNIQGVDIINLTTLSTLNQVGGNLSISYNESLSSLMGLHNITSINEKLDILDNPRLTSLNGLDKLTFIGKEIIISGNDALKNLNGLENITSLWSLHINSNDDLSNLSGLDNLNEITEGLVIENNASLSNFSGLDNLTTVGEDLYIYSNNTLANFTGLQNLTRVQRDIIINSNNALISFFGLNNLSQGRGNLDIEDNPALTTLSGLDHLNEILGSLTIRNNPLLTNLKGLQNLQLINGNINISYNVALTNICAIANASLLGNYFVIGNAENSTWQEIIDGEICSPVAVFSIYPIPAMFNGIVTFDARTSYHTNPNNTIIRYELDFDYSGYPLDFIPDIVSSDPLVRHKYGWPGTFTVGLRVIDANGNSDITTRVITVISADADGDGLSDYEETIYNTDIYNSDSDYDALSDGDEIKVWNTNPLDPDTDGDGLADSGEVALGLDPLDFDGDSDGDFLSDRDEVLIYGTDPRNEDSDYDGLSDLEEILGLFTDPLNEDTDEDGISDGAEHLIWETDPLDENDVQGIDNDGDGFYNYQSGGTDCKDDDANYNPETVQYKDNDGDGFGDENISIISCSPLSDYVLYSDDCDDSNAQVHPEAIELINGIDDNCDGILDNAQIVFIPDPNFEQALIDLGIDSDETKNGQILRIAVETVNSLDISNPFMNNNLPNVTAPITDLTGIEAFVNLSLLNCSRNSLTSLNLDQNTSLTTLDCSSNKLENLDVRPNTMLRHLICGGNFLQTIITGTNNQLRTLNCSGNDIIDLSSEGYSFLENMDCSGNKLSYLDLKLFPSLRTLNCQDNQLLFLETSQALELGELICFNNLLTSLDLSENYSLNNVWCKGLDIIYLGFNHDIYRLEAAACPHIIVNEYLANVPVEWSVDSDANIGLQSYNDYVEIKDPLFEEFLIMEGIDSEGTLDQQILRSDAIKVRSLDIFGSFPDLTGIEEFAYLQTFSITNNNELVTLDLSKNLAIRSVLIRDSYNLTSLNVGDLAKRFDNQLDSKLVPTLTCINVFDENADFSHWLVSQETTIGSACDIILIPDSNFEQALIDLGIDSDETINGQILKRDAEGVLSLNISDPVTNIKLPSVTEKISDLTGINAFGDLKYLDCGKNMLTELNLSNNSELTTLYTSDNNLTKLIVPNTPMLATIRCENNQLMSIDVSQNTGLLYLICYNNQIKELNVNNNVALQYLLCHNNLLIELDVSYQSNLTILKCNDNELARLNVQNGNNHNFTLFDATNNELSCINVDDETANHIIDCIVDPSGICQPGPWLIDENVHLSNNCEYNTPYGESIAILPVDATTSTVPVEVTFENVIQSGNTTLEIGENGPELLGGFSFGLPINYFDIATTASYTGKIQIQIYFGDMTYVQEDAMRLLHYDVDHWVDVTTLVDFDNNIIHGEVYSLSPFVIVEDIEPPVLDEIFDIVVNNDPGEAGAYISFNAPNASDNSPGVIVEQIDATGLTSGSLFPVGLTTLTYKATDIAGNSVTSDLNITVINTAPIIVEVIAHNEPLSLWSLVNVIVRYDDDDLKEATIDWGDGSGFIKGTFDDQTISWDYQYPSPGVYELIVRLTDWNQTSVEEKYQYIVIYDPEGGFVTGGGWINSPPGAYLLNPLLEGKANFGFVSKYKKGASIPTGNTEFQFKAGDLNFNSSIYDWLVIAGNKAKFKGEGTINGLGTYGFMISAIDCDLKDLEVDDRFRIKIWDKLNEDNVVYDNQIGEPDDSEASSVLDGGSIQIHYEKIKKNGNLEAPLAIKDVPISDVTIHPSHVDNIIYFDSPNIQNGVLKITLFDTNGRTMLTETKVTISDGVGSMSVSHLNLKSAIYLVCISIGDSELSQVKRIIKK